MSQDRAIETARAWMRYRQLMRWMALVAAAAVVFALLYLRSRGPVPLPMAIATVLGVGLSVMVGTALMGLVFMSSVGGYDDAAVQQRTDDE